MSVTLYPELEEYIFEYCGGHFWKRQSFNSVRLEKLTRMSNGSNTVMYKLIKNDVSIQSDQAIADLVSDGFEAFKKKIVSKIASEHFNELELNLCPACGKIARTPFAKQCRFCYHDWH